MLDQEKAENLADENISTEKTGGKSIKIAIFILLAIILAAWGYVSIMKGIANRFSHKAATLHPAAQTQHRSDKQ
ncbi:MAG: hypothetical protein R8K48_06455 [Gallionella sp.]